MLTASLFSTDFTFPSSHAAASSTIATQCIPILLLLPAIVFLQWLAILPVSIKLCSTWHFTGRLADQVNVGSIKLGECNGHNHNHTFHFVCEPL
jgi:hypothetical protein